MKTKISDDEILARTQSWLQEAVIELGFCPFAAGVYRDEAVRMVVCPADVPSEAINRVLDEVVYLLEASEEDVATTLVIFPNTFSDFDTFWRGAQMAREALSDAGANGLVQVADFHPDYQFEDADEDALQNYTNRSPFPILHLLRERHVTKAVERHPNPEDIPEQNIRRLEKLGRDEVERRWRQWMPS